MSFDSLTPLIIEYRYWILIPLSLLEGPVVAFVAGTLAAAGYFNLYLLELIFVIRDLVVDAIYYGLGMFAGRGTFVRRMLHKIGVTADHLGKARALWETHPLRTMFFGKISYGIAPSFFVVAGMVRMSLTRFMGYNASVAAFQYGVCLLAGYYFGDVFNRQLFNALNGLQYAVGAAVVLYVAYHFIRSSSRRRLLAEEKSAPEQ